MAWIHSSRSVDSIASVKLAALIGYCREAIGSEILGKIFETDFLRFAHGYRTLDDVL